MIGMDGGLPMMQGEKRQRGGYLSKSQFIRGLQCHKSLYLHKYHPELREELSQETKQRFQAGTEVGLLAQQLFPGGVNIPFDELSVSEQLAATQAAIAGGADTLYEAAFSHNDVFVKVDILHKGKNGWELYEVKGTTQQKDHHLDDVAIQYYVLRGAGLSLSNASLVHINNDYVRRGDIEVEKLFTVVDMTDSVEERFKSIDDDLTALREMLKGPVPGITIGDYCTTPYECDFWGYCWRDIPEDSVFSLKGRGVNKFELYKQGIVRVHDIPLDLLNNTQRFQVEMALTRGHVADTPRIKEFLDTLWYPLYFLDFETFQSAIPLYDGTRPYQQIPFQYSLHSLEAEGARLRHAEYLAAPGGDPRRELLEKLLEEIPDNGCVLAYHQQFEKQILAHLAEWFPDCAPRITALLEKMRDLALPFKERCMYCWEMQGSYSLKHVLPAVVPELTYEGMAISDGGMAMAAYFCMCESADHEEVEQIRRDLLAYCTLDTLAMVRLLEALSKSLTEE
jgi:hypothetical protein